MNKQFRCAVVGLGIGRHSCRNFHNHPDCQLVAVCDTDVERLEAKIDAIGAPALYTHLNEMLAKEDLDIVFLAIPNKYHKPATIAALEAGAHVICEKPMAMNAQEADDMLAAARKADRRLMINFSFRFNSESWVLKQEAASLGEIYFGRSIWLRRRGMPGFGGWFGQKALSGGGPLIDLGVHRLDLALWLMDYPSPTWVMASTYDHIASKKAKASGKKFDVEDLAVALIKFDNGATLELEASWASNIKEKELMETRLLGTEAGLVQRNLNEGYDFEAEIFFERNGVQYNMQPHATMKVGPQSAIAHLVASIQDDKPHIATGEEGRTVMQLLDAIYKSAASGAPINLQP